MEQYEQGQEAEVSTSGITTEKPGTLSIIGKVFTAPAEAFEAFNIKPFIIVSLVIVLAASGLFSVLSGKYNAQAQYEIMKQSQTLPPEALDRMRTQIDHPNAITSAAGGVFGILIMGIIAALIAWFVGSFILGGSATFKKVWGVTLLADLIVVVGNLIKFPLMAAKGSIYVSFGLAAFLPNKDFTSAAYYLLYYLDAFAIWSIIVAGIGYGVVFGVSRGKGMAVSITASLMIALVTLALMVIGMRFAGVEISLF